ncbi:hypothetical protein D3C86_1529520 [compost metagenome]
MRTGKIAGPKPASSKPIRVSESTHSILTWLASDSGTSMQEIVDKAVEEYRRKKLLDATNAAYASLRANPGAWAEVEQERAEWDSTNLDGL